SSRRPRPAPCCWWRPRPRPPRSPAGSGQRRGPASCHPRRSPCRVRRTHGGSRCGRRGTSHPLRWRSCCASLRPRPGSPSCCRRRRSSVCRPWSEPLGGFTVEAVVLPAAVVRPAMLLVLAALLGLLRRQELPEVLHLGLQCSLPGVEVEKLAFFRHDSLVPPTTDDGADGELRVVGGADGPAVVPSVLGPLPLDVGGSVDAQLAELVVDPLPLVLVDGPHSAGRRGLELDAHAA